MLGRRRRRILFPRALFCFISPLDPKSSERKRNSFSRFCEEKSYHPSAQEIVRHHSLWRQLILNKITRVIPSSGLYAPFIIFDSPKEIERRQTSFETKTSHKLSLSAWQIVLRNDSLFSAERTINGLLKKKKDSHSLRIITSTSLSWSTIQGRISLRPWLWTRVMNYKCYCAVQFFKSRSPFFESRHDLKDDDRGDIGMELLLPKLFQQYSFMFIWQSKRDERRGERESPGEQR